MAHDSHFLERVLRVSGPQTDLALGLYRDPERLRFVLEQARLPEGAGRVALALEPSPEGPFVVVERSGHFVTCLGAGMATDLPVITRPELDSLCERHEKIEARFGRAREALDSGSASKRLYRRLLNAGPALCREDFQVALDLAPLLSSTYMQVWVHANRTVASELPRTAARALKVAQTGRGDTTDIVRVWNSIWTAGHMSVLMREYNRRFVESTDPATLKVLVAGYTAEVAIAAILGPAIHTLWMFGRLGRGVLKATKQAHATARRPLEWLASAMCLGALGFRHERLRAEARKAIGVRPAFIERDGTPVAVLDAVQESLQLSLDGSMEAVEDLSVELCRGIQWDLTSRLETDLGDWRSPDDIPRDIACTVLSRSAAPLLADRGLAALLPFALAWFARAEAPTLFAPRALQPRLGIRNDPDVAVTSLARSSPAIRRHQAVAPAVPGRNEPCSCGSTRKYKHCCLGAVPA